MPLGTIYSPKDNEIRQSLAGDKIIRKSKQKSPQWSTVTPQCKDVVRAVPHESSIVMAVPHGFALTTQLDML